MNRNYWPPSLMHGQGSVGQPQHPAPNELSPISPGTGGGGALTGGVSNGAPHHQIYQLYGGYHLQGTASIPHRQQQQQHKSQLMTNSNNVIKSTSGSSSTSDVLPTTRRSISFTGGVPIPGHNCGGHPFHPQYAHMGSPQNSYKQNMPQVAHLQTLPAQPIRSGRIDRFSRTCKLPTVQEVGKLLHRTLS